MRNIYEITDNTDDERYYTLGMFLSLDEAIAALDALSGPGDLGGDHNDFDDFDSCVIEVHESPVGWGGLGKTVHTRKWVKGYNEAEDDYEWKREVVQP